MRKVFSSIRLETAEGVAELLEQHGVQTRLTNGRSYKGGRRRMFSYREDRKNPPIRTTVWVVYPEDQPKARAILRDAGLMGTTRNSYLPEGRARRAEPDHSPLGMAKRARRILLILVIVVAGFTQLQRCHRADPEPAAPIPESHIVPVELSL